MTRGNQSTIILFIMGAAIVLAAVLSLVVSTIRNRPDEPALLPTGEQVTITNQPITLRRNPNLTVIIVPPEEAAAVPEPTVAEVSQPEGGAEPATPAPLPTETPQQPAAIVTTLTPLPAQPAVNPVIEEPYVVQAGDTLYRITTLKATSITLMAQHGIAQDHLNPGETISIPIGNPAYCPGRRPYAVGEGETIFAISQKTNTTKEDLQAINQLDANFAIKAAQILCVP